MNASWKDRRLERRLLLILDEKVERVDDGHTPGTCLIYIAIHRIHGTHSSSRPARSQKPMSALRFGGTELGRALDSWQATRLEMSETNSGKQDLRLHIHT